MPNTGTKLHGKNGAIKVAGVKVAVKTDWTLNLARDTVDVTTFGDTNKTYVVGLRDISGTYAGLLDMSGDTLLTAASEDAKLIALYAEEGGTVTATGSGFIDAAITCSVGDAVRITGNFRAQGPWTTL